MWKEKIMIQYSCPKCENIMVKLPERKAEHPIPVASSQSASVYLYKDYDFHECPVCKLQLMVNMDVEGN